MNCFIFRLASIEDCMSTFKNAKAIRVDIVFRVKALSFLSFTTYVILVQSLLPVKKMSCIFVLFSCFIHSIFCSLHLPQLLVSNSAVQSHFMSISKEENGASKSFLMNETFARELQFMNWMFLITLWRDESSIVQIADQSYTLLNFSRKYCNGAVMSRLS